MTKAIGLCYGRFPTTRLGPRWGPWRGRALRARKCAECSAKKKPKSRNESGADALAVLDAQAIIAALTREAVAPAVEALLRSVDDPPCISAVNVVEVIDVLARTRGIPVDVVREKVNWLVVGALEVVPLDEHIGGLAGQLRARHYDRKSRAVSLADCCSLATAMARIERLATADTALAQMAAEEGVTVVHLASRP